MNNFIIPKGRNNRTTYFSIGIVTGIAWVVLPGSLGFLVLWLTLLTFGTDSSILLNEFIFELLYLSFGLAAIYIQLVNTIKRLHDIGHTGWWGLLSLIPLLNVLLFFYCLLVRGQADSNLYGPSPH